MRSHRRRSHPSPKPQVRIVVEAGGEFVTVEHPSGSSMFLQGSDAIQFLVELDRCRFNHEVEWLIDCWSDAYVSIGGAS